MCGIEEYSIADLKAHHVVSGGSSEFNRVLYWFWTAVSNFTGKNILLIILLFLLYIHCIDFKKKNFSLVLLNNSN